MVIRWGASRSGAECWADGLLGPLPWSLLALQRVWNKAKAEVVPWWAENSKKCYSSGLDFLARGLDAWLKSRHGTRQGRKVGFPRFKAKHTRRSFKVTQARADGLNKLTTGLAKGHEAVAVEDLDVTAMIASAKGRAQPGDARCRSWRAAPSARLQDRLVRLGPAGDRQVVSIV